MAAAQLAIAKASLLASLLKADADADLASCSRDEIEQFHGLLNAAVAKCSPTNVQKCKQWILQHLVPSPARAAAFGKYLVALASSFPSGSQKAPGPSPKRRRLHVLYVLNDILFHVKFRTRNHGFFDNIAPHLPALFKSAASFTTAPKHLKKLHDLLQLWEKKFYFPASVLESLRAAVEEGPKSEGSEANGGVVANKAHAASTARDAPFTLPSMHGDPSTPWYDLPAANWLPVIEPNSTRPMNPNMIKPLQLAGGPADKNLVDAVKKLLGDVDKIYSKDALLAGDSAVDVSQMGEFIERDELGDIVGGETYYGWSRSFLLSTTQNTQAAGYGPPKGYVPPNPQQYHHQQQQQPPPPPASYPPPNFPTGAPPQPSRFNSWNAAVPPPPPPHYQGQWPPPPPPPPPHMSPVAGNHGPHQPPEGWFPPHHSSGGPPVPGPPPGSWGGGWAPPPPPPPYPPQGHLEQQQQQQQSGGFQYGRGGNGGGGYRGRGGGGGYGRGRGW
ncbi:hypothetical protein LA080_006991 [Diaporthe eres]|nr:hypothetical protein LA080_006991 [Diaporthe eres]